MHTWEDLAGRALARQFPDVPGRDVVSVARALHLIGPIQAQTARSPFLALAARMPGVTLETISAAYDDHRIVRGSNIRGTVHTSTPEDNALLEVATRLGQRALWQRTLKLERTTLEDVWAGIEDFARDEWRTPAELSDPPRWRGSRATTRTREQTLDNAGRPLLRLRSRWPGPPTALGRLAGPGRARLPHRVRGDRRPDGGARRSRGLRRRARAPTPLQPRAVEPTGPRVVGRGRAPCRRRVAGPARRRPPLRDRARRSGLPRPARRSAAPDTRRRPAAAGVRRPVLRLRPEGARPRRHPRAPRTASGSPATG